MDRLMVLKGHREYGPEIKPVPEQELNQEEIAKIQEGWEEY